MNVGNTGMTESGGVEYDAEISSEASSTSLDSRAVNSEEAKTDTVFRNVSQNQQATAQPSQVHLPKKELSLPTETPVAPDIPTAVSQVKREAASKGQEEIGPEIKEKLSAPTTQAISEPTVSVHTKWAKDFQDPLSKGDQASLHRMIQKRRAEIREVKEDYRAKQQEALRLSTQIDENKEKILQIEKDLSSSEKNGQTAESNELRELLQIVKAEIEAHETALKPLESFLQNPSMAKKVEEHLGSGTLTPVEGGKSGVYFLRDSEGTPLFVIKPLDEEMLALNNPKAYATPYCDADDQCRPKGGIPMYQSVINEELASKVASLLGLTSTAPSQVMIIASSSFADITEGIEEDRALFGTPDKEKLCIVQEFLPGCREMGDILLSGGNITQSTFMAMGEIEMEEYEEKHSPKNVNQAMYEQGCILEWVSGETDGNAGNFMVGEPKNLEQDALRDIYKIDSAASFTEDNKTLRFGGCWVSHNYDRELSEDAKNIVRKIDSDKIAELMRSRGKSNKAIKAMEIRVWYLKSYIRDYDELTASNIDDLLNFSFSDEEPKEENR